MKIVRKNMRSDIREELLARMRSGAVEPGQRINEVQLASELGISRTPLREALIALATEGQLTSEDGKGFRFVPLSATEFEELCPIIVALEGLALDLSPVEDMIVLGHQLAVLAAEEGADLAVHALLRRRDDEWHNLMLSACPNRRLLEQTASVRLAIHRYESLLVPDDVMVERNGIEHADIARHLRAGDIPSAKLALNSNWRDGLNRLLTNAAISWDRST